MDKYSRRTPFLDCGPNTLFPPLSPRIDRTSRTECLYSSRSLCLRPPRSISIRVLWGDSSIALEESLGEGRDARSRSALMLIGYLVRKHYSRMAGPTRSNRNIKSFVVKAFWSRCECRTGCSPILSESAAAFEWNGQGPAPGHASPYSLSLSAPHVRARSLSHPAHPSGR